MTSGSTLPREFNGEFLVPGKSDHRMQADHTERYRFACRKAHGCRVLDIACGVGYAAPLYIEAGAVSYTGVDLNEQLVSNASDVYSAPNIEFHVGDITKFRSDKPFDLVSCFETIEHVPDYRAALCNLASLVRPGGELLISSPNRPVTSPSARSLTDKPENPYHTQEFTPAELADELRSVGFIVEDTAVFAQRQSSMPSNAFMRAMYKTAFGNPKKTASPVVERLKSLTPRYFLIVAQRPA